ncbi:MAG TPA: asparagine synthase (glutamine-hydrolyzing) [Thermodesulfobacteriota bacterium]|nr:asparagine synthase (glutamine-hydrolyzing) [Thermodesulfobacteriota bacterium]
MGGICGFVDTAQRKNAEWYVDTVNQMAERLRHRGPDDSGVWVDAEAGLAFGHRRLSVIDLTPQGHQPMISACGRYVIVYNGEIYNHRHIRSELDSEVGTPSIPWKGHSDTEVILAAISQWGMEKAIHQFNGMFAFALWDRKDRILYLARDRMGEKPVYYGWAGNTLLFGSELKALVAHPAWRNEVDRDALALFMRYSYIPAPYSIYRGICKLLPGMILRLPLDSASKGEYTIWHYWSAKEAAEIGEADTLKCSEEEATDQLNALLRDAVKMRMEADVPLGAFLSGGVDSSTVVALMQAQSDSPVQTFTIGFQESDYNEAKYARTIAEHLGTNHSELYVASQDVLDIIPFLPACYDEPFSDSSQIPTFILSKFVRQHVTVSLSGDGGDAILLGQSRYKKVPRFFKKTEWLPRVFRSLFSKLMLSVPAALLDYALSRVILPLISKHSRPGQALKKLRRAAETLDYHDKFELYIKFISRPRSHANLIRDAGQLPSVFTDREGLLG